MELPYNTTISRDLLSGTGQFEEGVADWATKRRWVAEAFAALEAAGYHVGSAYTAVKDPSRTRFVYRDRLWQGADLVGLGVASFGHVNGVHMQNLDQWEPYSAAVRRGEIPLEPRLPADARGADDPRAGAAAEARLDPARVLPRTSTAWTSWRASASRSRRSRPRATWRRPARSGGADARRACCGPTSCSAASSCPSTSGIRYT